MNKDEKISVVIPCYNEEESLFEMLNRVIKNCKIMTNNFEILLINDGSIDRTLNLMLEAQNINNEIIIINLSRNFGHQKALTAGLSHAKGKYIFVIDADLQDPPELFPEMLQVMKNTHADIVYGQRLQRKGETVFKLLTAKIFYKLLNLFVDIKIPADTGDFRLINSSVLEVFLSMPESSRFIRGMFSWIGFKQVAFQYNRDIRFAGTTKYPLSKMFKLAFDAIISFSTKPLKVGIYLGAIGCLFGLLGLLFALSSYLLGKTISGWTSLVSIIVILGGIQIFLIGLIGEYIGRIFIESQKRPLYIIKEIFEKNR